MKNILIVDDDQHIRNLVSIFLREQGFTVLQAKHGKEALDILEKEPCDLAIVDIMMPNIDGYELTKDIREFYDIPIIMLTAKDQIEAKEKGFLSGTDDYLVKPFELKELLYRMKTLFRLYDKQVDDILTFGATVISKKTYEVKVKDQSLLLPLKEFELLFFLASHEGQVFTRDQLIERVWGYDFTGDIRTVDVHIKRIRERFRQVTNDFQIKTVRGIGYSL